MESYSTIVNHSKKKKLILQMSSSAQILPSLPNRPSSTTCISPSFDLISKFENYPHILEKIFSYLRPIDLRVLPCVSVNWYYAVYYLAIKANGRRLQSIKHLKKVKHRVGMVI